MSTLKTSFESWVSHDKALYSLGEVLGLFDKDSYSSLEVTEVLGNPTCWQKAVLEKLLEDTVEAKDLEVNDQQQYRWLD